MKTDEQWLLEEKYGGEKSAAFFADCERLAAGEPLAYVIGWIPFLNCKIYLNSQPNSFPPISSSLRHRKFLSGGRNGEKAKQFAFSPLIPRVETEFWTERAITEIQNYAKAFPRQLPRKGLCTVRVLDLCAGSGAIGVAVAKAIPEAHITFAEIDPAHLPTIEKNCRENEIETSRYTAIQSDLFKNVDGTFDYILTNPPYINIEANTVEASVEMNEPHLALFGGEEGMEVIGSIIAGARAKLAPLTLHSPGGQLWIEHEPEQSKAVQRLGANNQFKVTTHKDQYGVERYSSLVLQ